MRTPRLPVVDWTDAPADLNGHVRFAERRNLVFTRLTSHFNWPLLQNVTKKFPLTDLCWQHYQSDAYHDDHVQLWGPNVGDEVTISDCGEGDDHEVGGLEQVQMPMAGSLEVLNTTNTAQTNTQGTVSSKGLCRQYYLVPELHPQRHIRKKSTHEFRKLYIFPSSSVFRQTKLRMWFHQLVTWERK